MMDGPPRMHVHVEPAMGTMVSIRAEAPALAWVDVEGAVGDACARIHALESDLTTWDSQSPMSRLRRGELGVSDAPEPVVRVLELCAEVRELSRGWFDPWSMRGGVDPTGLAKGWILEEAMAVLRTSGVASAVVNGGGDLCLLGTPPDDGRRWRVGVQHPWRPDSFAAVLSACGSVATSGTYARGLHLVDPRTRCAVPAAASATVVGPNLAVADGLATALAVGGDEVLECIERTCTYDGYLIRADGSEAATQGIEFVPALAEDARR